jgi:hypothetical protein
MAPYFRKTAFSDLTTTELQTLHSQVSRHPCIQSEVKKQPVKVNVYSDLPTALGIQF